MELRILNAIKDFADKKSVRLHMPGHKGNFDFTKIFKGAELDTTELSVIDNEKVVELAQKDMSEIFGSEKSWFLTNGSSSGVLSMVYALKNKGSKLIIGRGSHKSVYSALEICGIEPIIIDDENYDENFYNEIEKRKLDDLIGALLTYPDYYGKIFDIKRVSEILRDRNEYLLIDGAHGGHFKFVRDSVYAGDYADVWVDGLHKTFPVLNQGAILHTANSSLSCLLEDAVSKFLTTSPSYPLLASIEYGVKFYYENKKLLDAWRDKIIDFVSDLKDINVPAEIFSDPYKVYLPLTDIGVSLDGAEEIFNKDEIYFEMKDKRGFLMMLTPFNTDKDLKRLYSAIKKLNPTQVKATKINKTTNPQRVMPYLRAVSSEKTWVDIKNADGKIASANVGNFPPCKPIIVAGEKFSKEVIESIDLSSCFGVNHGKVLVVKEDK